MDNRKLEQREYRDLTVKAIPDNYRVKGFATTYNQPYHLFTDTYDDYTIEYKEQVDKHAFDNTDMSDTILQYNHEGRVFARMSNGTLALNKDNDEGLEIDAFLGGTEIGRQLYEEIKGGYTNKMSFGFKVRGDRLELQERGNTGEVWLRTITDISKVFDVSAVSLPANDFTSISAKRYAEGVSENVRAELLKAREEEKKATERLQKLAELETRISKLKGE